MFEQISQNAVVYSFSCSFCCFAVDLPVAILRHEKGKTGSIKESSLFDVLF